MATTETPGAPPEHPDTKLKSDAAGGMDERRARQTTAATRAPSTVDRSRTVVVGETRWLRLETLFYRGSLPPPQSSGDGGGGGTDDDTQTATATAPGTPLRPWDRVVRTTKATEDSIDAVAILVILRGGDSFTGEHKSDGDRIVLVRQYRPAVDAYTLEMPAGLIEDGETPVQAAIREFREETGYVGEALVDGDGERRDEHAIMPLPLPLSPGLTNECVTVVRLDVDMSRVENRHPQPKADGCEEARGLETVLLPLRGLGDELRRMHVEEGVLVFGMLYSFALALELRPPPPQQRTGGDPSDLVWLE